MTCICAPLSLRPARTVCRLAFLAGLAWSSSGCVSTGLFEARHTVTFPEDEEIALGQKAFDQAILSRPMSQNAEHRHMVERVGQRLVRASGQSDLSPQFVLVSGTKAEATCLPGGKMIVSEGMLAYCENEAGLAAVMAHELAHLTAKHGHHRAMNHVPPSRSRRKMDPAEVRRQMVEAGYGLSSGTEGAPPFAHNHEAEADSIGLQIMAKAGYDPREAPRLWERLAALEQSKRPEFARVHPATTERTATLAKLMPTAMSYYNQSSQVGLGMAIVTPPPGSDGKGKIALAGHEETAAKSQEKLVKTADVSGSSDPFLGSPSPAVTTPAATAVSVAKVDLPAANEAVAAKPAEQGSMTSLVPPASATASNEAPAAMPAFAARTAPAAPLAGESAAPAATGAAWAGGAKSQGSDSAAASDVRWARPVAADPANVGRVPRPTTDLSATPVMPVEDDWRTTRDARPNPFAGR